MKMVCPRCGTVMVYRAEITIGNGDGSVVEYYYRCPRCGYRLHDLTVRLARNRSGGLVLVARINRRANRRRT